MEADIWLSWGNSSVDEWKAKNSKNILTTHGKPAGVHCVQLLPDLRCALFGKPERPVVCVSLRPTEEMCGSSREAALAHLYGLELATKP